MNVIKIRRFADFFTCLICILFSFLIVFFVLTTYKMNEQVATSVSNINKLFIKLDADHQLNSQLTLETLEFRKIEYRCYLSQEGPEFINRLNNLLSKYVVYINEDKTLTPEERKKLLVHVAQVEKAVKARIDLTNKLVEYDKKREFYLEQLPSSVTIENKELLQIIDK